MLALLPVTSCRYDPAYRDVELTKKPLCVDGVVRCKDGPELASALVRCDEGTETTVDDCKSKNQVCAPSVLACRNCIPGGTSCSGLDVMKCDANGDAVAKVETCDAGRGVACRRW